MENRSVARLTVQKISADVTEQLEDQLAVEEPLEIRVQYTSEGQPASKAISVTMRTPGHDQELAAGFLFTEGIITAAGQVATIDHLAYDQNIIQVSLSVGTIPKLQQAERNFYTTSSCGVCGKSSIDAIKTVTAYPRSEDELEIEATLLYRLPDLLRDQQLIFEHTGGLHASALFDMEGHFLQLREDVGRHNALDKLIGACLLNDQLPLDKAILLLSGRASFELIQKAVMAGIKIVAAVGAPSSLAVQLAHESGITLAGFLRGTRVNIYTHAQRIKRLSKSYLNVL